MPVARSGLFRGIAQLPASAMPFAVHHGLVAAHGEPALCRAIYISIHLISVASLPRPHPSGAVGAAGLRTKDWPPDAGARRQTRDVMTLRRLVEMCHAQNLAEAGGIDRRATSRAFARIRGARLRRLARPARGARAEMGAEGGRIARQGPAGDLDGCRDGGAAPVVLDGAEGATKHVGGFLIG